MFDKITQLSTKDNQYNIFIWIKLTLHINYINITIWLSHQRTIYRNGLNIYSWYYDMLINPQSAPIQIHFVASFISHMSEVFHRTSQLAHPFKHNVSSVFMEASFRLVNHFWFHSICIMRIRPDSSSGPMRGFNWAMKVVSQKM